MTSFNVYGEKKITSDDCKFLQSLVLDEVKNTIIFIKTAREYSNKKDFETAKIYYKHSRDTMNKAEKYIPMFNFFYPFK